jgi:hypothetical protein
MPRNSQKSSYPKKWSLNKSKPIRASGIMNCFFDLPPDGAEQVPSSCRLTRAGLGQHLNTCLQPYGIGHCGALSLPLQH